MVIATSIAFEEKNIIGDLKTKMEVSSGCFKDNKLLVCGFFHKKDVNVN
jgi:hypothetical protein